jgi:hypothetical protein
MSKETAIPMEPTSGNIGFRFLLHNFSICHHQERKGHPHLNKNIYRYQQSQPCP